MGLGVRHFQRINGEYRIHEKIGKGSFAKVYRVTDVNGVNLAAKFVPEKYADLLEHETRAMRKVEIPYENGTAYWHYYGRHGKQSVLVMDLFGKSLFDIQVKYGHLSLKSVLLLGIQMTSRLEALHNRGFIHRDIKPENFMIGKHGDTRKCLYLIDYGFAKTYQNSGSENRLNSTITYFYGSKNFASRQAHKGEEQSRRSDLESVVYVIISLLRVLPWSSTNCEDVSSAGHMKENITTMQLCGDLPSGVQRYYSDVMSLGSTESPDYDRLRGYLLFTLRRHRLDTDDEFEWTHRIE